MISKINNASNRVSFNAHFINDKEGNLIYLYNKSRGMLNKKEFDYFSREIPNHKIEILNINEGNDKHIDGVGLFNHESGEFKYIDTSDVSNVAVLNKVIKKLNSLYNEGEKLRKHKDYEKLYSAERGFFKTDSYYSEIYRNNLK